MIAGVEKGLHCEFVLQFQNTLEICPQLVCKGRVGLPMGQVPDLLKPGWNACAESREAFFGEWLAVVTAALECRYEFC
jgi:hypothetical protein